MADDTSVDVTPVDNDADVPDVPLFDQPATEQPAPEAPSTTEDIPADKGSDTEETTETDKPDAEAKDTEATEQAEDKPEDAAQTDEQSAKGQPDPQLARQAYLERQRTRTAVEQQINENYAPKSQDELYQEAIDQGLDEQQANVQAQIQSMREEMQFAQQRAQISELNATMQAEAVNAVADFPVFNDKSPDYDPDFANMVQEQYQRAARLQTEVVGKNADGSERQIILNAEVPLYDFYKSMADIYSRAQSKGSQQGQAQAVETLSRVESVQGGSSSTSRGPETLEEMGERLADLPLI